MKRTIVLLMFLAGISIPASTASGATDGSGVGIRLLDAPTDRRDDPRARTYIVDHLPPGGSLTRRVEVSNNTSRPALIQVYTGAAELRDGAFEPLAESEISELTTWSEVAPTKLDMAPGQRSTATVTIMVPHDASPGERYGAVWASLSSAEGQGVTQINRVGIRIYLSVGPGGEPASDFTIDSLTASRASDGTPIVTAQVHNTGGRALDLGGELVLSDGPGGLSGGPFTANLGTTLAVGQTEPIAVTLDAQLPAGPWQATLNMKSGILQRTATAEITFPEAGASGPEVAAESNRLPWVMILVLAIALLVLAAVVAVVQKRRGRSATNA